MSLCNFSFVFLALVPGIAGAQSLNIDIQTGAGAGNDVLPLNTFGGVPNQYGVWNDWRPPTFLQPMTAIDGTPTPVLMSHSFSSPPIEAVFSAVTVLDALRDDFLEATFFFSQGGGHVTFAITGLTAGTYDVFTYAGLWNCGHPNIVSIPTPGSIDPPQAVEGHARHRVQVTAGTIEIRVQAHTLSCANGYMVDCMGMQLVKLGEATPICAGDGSGAACPCANSGGLGRGCATSFEPLGALLSSSGTSSVSSDNFALSAGGVSNAGATFFQGSDAFGGGAGIAFADGLLCSGGAIVRLVTRFASSGQVSYPLVGDASISTLGGPQTAGSQRLYQVWYRDSAPGFCTNATFNLTNGVRTVWAP